MSRPYEIVYEPPKHYTLQAYEKIVENLEDGEYLIKKVWENDSTTMMTKVNYNVCYLSNFGNIHYVTVHCSSGITHKKLHITENVKLPQTLRIKDTDRKFSELEMKIISKYTFKNSHYSSLQTEINQLLEFSGNILDSILNL